MSPVWNALNYRIRNQIYLRTLPAILLALGAVAVVGWSMFAGQVTDTMLGYQAQELGTCLERVTARAASEAMSLESMKGDILAHDRTGRDASTFCWAPTPGDIPTTDLVMGLAILAETGPRAGRPFMAGFVSGDSLVQLENQKSIEAWLRGNRGHFHQRPRHQDLAGTPSGQPLEIHSYRWHRVSLFPPLILQDRVVGEESGTRVLWHSLLPVLVQERGRPGGRDPAREPGEPTGGQGFQAVYFLDLQELLRMSGPDDWWCALDDQGRILAGADPQTPIGVPLADLPAGKYSGILSQVSGADLLGGFDPGHPSPGQGSGSRLGSWLVNARGGQLPFTVVAGRSASILNRVISRYTLMVLGAGTLALIFAFGGLTRVVNQVTRRLSRLGVGMRRVAEGDLDHRLDSGPSDEVTDLVHFFNDMTENLKQSRKDAQANAARLQASLANMKLLDKAKQDFLVLISHEVRTPLTAIMGGVDYLNSTMSDMSPDEIHLLSTLNLQEILTIIENNGQRLRGFMNDAILMTNMQSTARRLDFKPVSGQDLVCRVIQQLEPKFTPRGIKVVNEIEEGPDWSIIGDSDTLEVALTKVLDNAIVHNEDQGVVVIRDASVLAADELGQFLGLESKGRCPDNWAADDWDDLGICWRMLEIYNTGQTIPRDRQEALFRQFELVGPIENHARGTGLSLPIAQAALDKHGGRIFCRSTDEHGNSFFLLLPVLDPNGEGSGEIRTNIWDEAGQGFGSRSRYKNVCQRRDSASLEVELHDGGPPFTGHLGQAGGRIDRPGGTHDKEEIALSRSPV